MESIRKWCNGYHYNDIKESVADVLDRVPGSPHVPPPLDYRIYALGTCIHFRERRGKKFFYGGGNRTKGGQEVMMEAVMGVVEDVTKDTGTGGLVRATLHGCTRNDDKNIEENPEQGHTKDDRCDDDVDFPEVAGECQPEK